MKPYTTLVFADIIQDSPLSYGGNQPHLLVDSPLALDGKKRPILRGTSLAGVFLSQAKKLFATEDECKQLLYPTHQNDKEAVHTPASIKFANAHLKNAKSTTEFFQHVSINQNTQAAKDDALFNLEALSQGQSWELRLEINTLLAKENSAALECLTAHLLQQWQQPHFLQLGKGSRHGYGWCHLENLKFVRLTTEHLRLWPKATAPAPKNNAAWLNEFAQEAGVEILSAEQLIEKHQAVANQLRLKPSLTTHLQGSIKVGKREDDFGAGYGFDPLSVGGHARLHFAAEKLLNKVLAPKDYELKTEEFKPDFVITVRQNAQGELEPYIPGASLRGVLRSHLSRYLTANKEAVPSQQTPKEFIELLFGSTEQAGKLFISDASLTSKDWKLLWQNHLAVDEFSGSVYGSGKFDRLSLGEAEFSWAIKIEASSAAEQEHFTQIIRQLIQQLGAGLLPVGGGVWRGYGHIHWQLED